jgi:hypothetical protein
VIVKLHGKRETFNAATGDPALPYVAVHPEITAYLFPKLLAKNEKVSGAANNEASTPCPS